MQNDSDQHGQSSQPAPTTPPPSAKYGSSMDSGAVGAEDLIGHINWCNSQRGTLVHNCKLPIDESMQKIPRRVDGKWRGMDWTADLIAYWPASKLEPAYVLYELTEINYGPNLPF